MNQLCLNEEIFNASHFWNSSQPQFTRCFQDTIPSWCNAALICSIVPFHVNHLLSRQQHLRRPIEWSLNNASRLLLLFTVIAVNCVRFVYDFYSFMAPSIWHTPSIARVLSSILNIFTFSLFAFVLLLHRKHGIHTSWIAFTITLVAALLSLPFLYTYFGSFFLNDEDNLSQDYYKTGFPLSIGPFTPVLDVIQSFCLIVIFIQTCFADKIQGSDSKNNRNSVSTPLLDRRDHRFDMKTIDCPVEKCSFFSLITFSFVGKLMSKGYRHILTIDDMWNLRTEDSNDHVNQRWERIFSKNHSVFFTMLNSPLFYCSIVLRLCYDILKYVKPQILKLFLGLFTVGSVHPLWNGYALAAAFFFTSLLQSLAINNYFMVMFFLSNRVKSALTSTIYKRSLRLSNEERVKTTSGEIFNLVSVDAHRLANFLPDFHLIWSCPLQVIFALYFLYIELGLAIFAGVGVLLVLIPINAYISRYQQNKEKEQMEKKDERMKVINEVLSGIKVIKLYGWEIPFISKISMIRAEEIKHLRSIATTLAINSFVWSCAPIAVSFCAFAVYISGDTGNVLTVEKAFVSLALFEGLRFPMAEISAVLTDFATRMISVKRLDKFYNDTKEIVDYVQRDEINNGNVQILIENGMFTWKDDESKPDLRNINLKIKKGSIVAIVGNVAMGKSSLLNAILGNMKMISGKVVIDSDSKIAYVAQQAWIQNATLRENILFGNKYNPRHYRKIVNICALKADFAALPGGDKTEIGEKGINLSGGQKQRVAMARACYSDCDLFLFDDPLSAVDSHVGKHIFDHVLSSKTGFLKEQTRVLVTNNIQFLPDVDQIIVISNGVITDIGTYKELVANGSDFAEFLQEYSNTTPETPPIEHHELVHGSKSPKPFLRTFSIESNHELETGPSIDQLIDEERIEVGHVKWKIYLKYLQAFTVCWMTGLVGGYSLMQIAQVGTGIWLAYWSQSSAVSSQNSSSNSTAEDVHNQMYYLEVYGIIGSIQVFFSIISLSSLVIGGMKTSITFHKTLLWGVLRSPMTFFDTTPIGRILNRFSKDMESIDSEITGIMDGYIFCLMHVLSTLFLVIYKLPIFAVLIVPLFIAYHYISRFFVATSRQLQRLESISKSPIFSHFTETLSGMTTIRAFGVEQRFLNEASKRIDTNIRCIFPRPIINRWLSLRLEILGSSILLFVTILILIYRESFAAVPGLIGLLVTYAMYITDNLNWMTRMSAEMETNIVSVERIQEYTENVQESSWSRPENRSPKLEADWPKGKIEFVDYSLRYREGLDLVIRDLSLQINPGEKIGIVGRTGAGKSSLTLALFRIVEAASGSILLDGINIREIGLHELRSKLSIIPQDPILFSGTIRSNLDPFSSYSDETIWKALEHSHLKEFVNSVQEGLEYVVSENGENLSVGQRQLICLGRALLRHTKILVLDEATASVDLETDSLIQNTIRKEFVGSTILTIAHRLNTILDYDRVMVLDQGRLLEFDSPQKLLANPESHFHSLAKDARII